MITAATPTTAGIPLTGFSALQTLHPHTQTGQGFLSVGALGMPHFEMFCLVPPHQNPPYRTSTPSLPFPYPRSTPRNDKQLYFNSQAIICQQEGNPNQIFREEFTIPIKERLYIHGSSCFLLSRLRSRGTYVLSALATASDLLLA